MPTIDTTFRRTLPKTYEFFRAVSGLAAIAALVVMVMSLSVVAETDFPPAGNAAPVAQPRGEPWAIPATLPRAFPSSPVSHPVMVFYLVASRQQEFFADSRENLATMEANRAGVFLVDRLHKILYASNEEQERLAGQAILNAITGLNNVPRVEVIDLRMVQPDGNEATRQSPPNSPETKTNSH